MDAAKKKKHRGKLKIPEVAYKYPSHVNSTDIRLKNKLPVLRQNIVPGYNLHCIDSVFGTSSKNDSTITLLVYLK
jgi:hypothetical protein